MPTIIIKLSKSSIFGVIMIGGNSCQILMINPIEKAANAYIAVLGPCEVQEPNPQPALREATMIYLI